LLIALGVVAILYILIQIVCVGTLPDLAQSQKPLADAGLHFLGNAGGALISAGAMISITGNLNILILSGSRIPFAMAEQKQLPAFLSKVHPRFFTPHAAIAITATLMLIFTLRSSFVAALTISTIARLVTYGATCISLLLLRYRRGTPAALFRLPGGPVIAVLSVGLILWLLVNSTLAEAIIATIVAVIGLLLYSTYRFYSRAS
jgi:amino acid transporter